MSKLGKVTLTFQISGDGLSTPTITVEGSNALAPYRVDHLSLTAAVFSAQNAPNDANNPVRYALVVPPTGSTSIKTLKGVTGDTGIGLTGVGWTSQFILLPMGNNQAWGILGVSTEVVDVYYF